MADDPSASSDSPAVAGYELASQLWDTPRSQVWRAHRASDGAAVILKLINERQPSPERLGRFRREYELAGRLQGDGAPLPLALESLGRGAMLVFADTGGITCDKLLAAEGTLSAVEATRVALGVARILDSLHGQGLIHKDINPSNILRNRQADRVELIDFELASELGQADVAAPHPGQLEGTLAYIAPEQTGRMNRGVDYRADFYALGASLFALLAGAPPFDAEDSLALVHSHIAVAPPDLGERAPGAPAPLARIVARLLAKTPEARYQSAAGLVADLAACHEALAAGRPVPDFAPGAYDIPASLQIPEKLYGREDASRALRAGFDRAAQGDRVAAMVTGDPGIGKSALVRELYQPVTARHGYFLTGKFDQLQHDRPYSALLQAGDDLVRQLLAASEAELAAWRAAIQAALGPNAGVMVQFIPELARIVGDAPPPPKLDPEAERHRLNDTLSRFVGAICGADHPVVLFLDDLQWADTASLGLLRNLLLDPDLGYLYVVGAYREGDVDDSHPLARLIAELSAQANAPVECDLAGLGEDDVARLVADTLNTSVGACADLARQAYVKTLGNPFFLERLLGWWAEKGLIWPDRAAGRWRWDSAAVAASAVADNVVQLMADKLHSLPEPTQVAVAQAAILGNQVDLANLAVIAQDRPAGLLARLWPAVTADIIRPVDEAYKYVGEEGHSGHAWLRFRHDRIQQAALALLPAESYRATQLSAGRLLLADIRDPQTDERLFEALGHLNDVQDRLAGPEERDRLVRLNLLAGERAQRAAAHGPADAFLRAGLALLGEAPWGEAPELAHALTQARAESAYVLGEMGRMRSLTDNILAQVRDPAVTARARQLRIQAHVFDGAPSRGVDEGLASLAALGVKLPSHPGKPAVLAAFVRTRRLLKGLDVARQPAQEEIAAPHQRAIMDLLASLNAPAYLGRPQLLPLVVMRHVRLSVAWGNHPSSALAFASYAVILMAMGRPVGEASRYARLAEALVAALGAERYRCATDFIAAYFIDAWQEDLATIAERLVGIHEAGLRGGDIEYAAFAVHSRTGLQRMLGKPLGQIDGEMAVDERRVAKTGQGVAFALLRQHRQHIYQFYEPLAEPAELNGPYAYGAEAAEELRRQGNYNALVAKAQVKALCGYHYDALADLGWWLDLLGRYVPSLQGAPNFANALATYVAVSAARGSAGLGPSGLATRRRLRRHLARLDALLARIGNPGCYSRYVELARGELRRLEGRYAAALAAFEAAVAAAEAGGYVAEAGLARERAGRLQEARGLPWLAAGYIQEAAARYGQWEAYGKIAHLQRRYPALGIARGAPGPAGDTRRSVTATGSNTQTLTRAGETQLDLEAVVRAAQAIAQEIRPAQLAQRLMAVVGQTAGATHGALLLGEREEALQLQAVLDSEAEPSVTVLMDSPPAGGSLAERVPMAAVRFALRRRELVVGDSPATARTYRHDPYIMRHQPGAILCLPLANQGRITGVLYVEHRHAAGAFPASRTDLLGLLSTQMAVSLENAQLYSDMEAQVAARTRELAELARTDALTGLANRRHVMAVLQAEFERSRRQGHVLALLMLDIDRFKHLNDSYGHEAGDRVLAALAAYLQEALRVADTAGRFGGEEILVILPETDLVGAREVAERLRRGIPAVLAERLDPALAHQETVTVSIGVAAATPDGDDAAEALLQAADGNLYAAKEAGRNCVIG